MRDRDLPTFSHMKNPDSYIIKLFPIFYAHVTLERERERDFIYVNNFQVWQFSLQHIKKNGLYCLLCYCQTYDPQQNFISWFAFFHITKFKATSGMTHNIFMKMFSSFLSVQQPNILVKLENIFGWSGKSLCEKCKMFYLYGPFGLREREGE